MKKRLLSVLVIMAIVIGIMPVVIYGGEEDNKVFVDMPNNWSTAALENAVSNGLLLGDGDKILPNDNFTDVKGTAWYYSHMAKAVQMKLFVGHDHKLNPDNDITREEAFTVLARALKLSEADELVLDRFLDKERISSWAKNDIAALVEAGYIEGADGKLNPRINMKRAEFAQMMDKIVKKYISEEREYTEDVEGNLMVNTPNVTLKKMTINGDLIVGDGVGDGDIYLDSVVVTGRILVRGGGKNSIKILGDSKIQNIIVARVNGEVRVYTEDEVEIEKIIVVGNDTYISGEGNIILVEAKGNNIIVLTPGTKVTALDGATNILSGVIPVNVGETIMVPVKKNESARSRWPSSSARNARLIQVARVKSFSLLYEGIARQPEMREELIAAALLLTGGATELAGGE